MITRVRDLDCPRQSSQVLGRYCTPLRDGICAAWASQPEQHVLLYPQSAHAEGVQAGRTIRSAVKQHEASSTESYTHGRASYTTVERVRGAPKPPRADGA